jgi:hypothetical protein
MSLAIQNTVSVQSTVNSRIYRITHFCLGASIGCLLLTRYSTDELLTMITTGVWAMGPEIEKIQPFFSPIHDSIVSNVFLFHGLLDATDPSDSIVFGVCSIGLFIVLALMTYPYR